MTIAKSRLIEVIKHLPEQVDLDDLMYRLYLLGKIEKGEADIRAGRMSLNDKMLQKIKKW